MMNIQDVVSRVNDLLNRAESILNNATQDRKGMKWVDSSAKAQIRVSVLSFFDRVFGKDSAYYSDFEAQSVPQIAEHFKAAVGTLRAAKEEIDGGWIFTTRGLISSEIFADYLEMADHLVYEGYKDAAAVIAGSTLEEHLRQLCNRYSLPVVQQKQGKTVHLKADRLNADLTKANVYTVLDQKNVTAWLDLRNKAAHGKYGEYTDAQVKLMVQSIRDYITRNPI